jgi:hypothetical protein
LTQCILVVLHTHTHTDTHRQETGRMSRYQTVEWAALVAAQNSERYSMVDILTITGFMNDEQFLAHVVRYTA